MKITVYSSIKNVPDFNAGVPMLCYPKMQGDPYEIQFTFDLDKVQLMANQSGIWISKKPTFIDKLKNKLRKVK